MKGTPSREFHVGRRALLASMAAWAVPRLAHAQDAADFAAWLAQARNDAIAAGIAPTVVDGAFRDLAPIDRVVELDNRQPEFTLSTRDYLARVVSPTRIQTGRARRRENADLLAQAEARYRVDAAMIAALWGIESNYGAQTGTYQIVAALATLAFAGRAGNNGTRRNYFRGEMLNALRVMERTGMSVADLRGSWAGAMGQCQFMPSSYLNFATDMDGDNVPDIWNSRADVFASIANYLARSDWRPGERWGGQVEVPRNFDRALIDFNRRASLAEWHRRGVRFRDGRAMTGATEAALIQPDEGSGPLYLVGANFRALMRWNRSYRFALAAGLLADSLA